MSHYFTSSVWKSNRASARTWIVCCGLLSVLAVAGCATAPATEAHVRVGIAGTDTPTLLTVTAAESPYEPALDETASLGDYLTYAALHNPEVEAAYYRWQAAVEAVPQARTLPDPRLTYARYIEEVETRTGPQENRLGLSQTFPWFGTLRTKGERAREQAEAARWRYEQAKLVLFFRVVDAYAEYYYLGRATLITEENLALLVNFEEVARRRYEVAQASYSDVVKAQVELGKLSDRVRTLHARRRALAAMLNAALNRPADAPVPWPRTLPDPAASYDTSALRETLPQNNPQLRALSSDVEAAVRAVELARLRSFPDLTVGVDWIDTDRALMPTPESGKDPVIAKFSINVPLWYRSYRAGEREAEAKVQAAVHRRAAQRNTLESRLERAVFRYDDSKRKIDLFRDTLIPKAQQSLQATQTAFTTAAGDFLTVLDAQRILLEFQLSAERALADSAQRNAEITMLLGTARLPITEPDAADFPAPSSTKATLE